ncbi:MAG: cytochrome P450 [Myxococcota bacterium]
MQVNRSPMMTYPPGPERLRRWQVLQMAKVYGALFKDPIAFIGGRFAAHGDLYHLHETGGGHLYATQHPDHLHELLVTRHKDMQKRGGANDRLVPILGDGLLTADGETWKKARKLMNPRFHRKAIAGYAQTMVDHAERVSWQDGAQVDVSAIMMGLTLNIVVRSLFDHEVNDETDVIARTMGNLRRAGRGTIMPSWVPTPQRSAARRALSDLHRIIDDLVQTRRTEGLREDLLSMLIDVGMDGAQIRDQLVTLFLAGHDTTSHALSWTWWLLATHPEVEARLHAELDEVLGHGLPDGDTELPYTDAVIAETLRRYPPAFAVPRVARVDTELGGFPIAAGSQVIGWVWHAHHDPRWWDEPMAFRPERFLSPLKKREAYLPFGGGPRMCIGAGFAKMELRLLLATIARNVRFEASPGQVVNTDAGVTLAPKGGLPLTVRRRGK